MKVHYVDDNPADGALVRHTLQVDSGLQVRHALSIDQLMNELIRNDADCILLDVIRPDSISMEDDIRRIRERTNAPVVFISGSVAEDIRAQGLQAGAYAVIEKTVMRSPVLKQILTNAQAVSRSQPSEFRADIELDYEDAGPVALPNYNLARFNLLFKRVQDLFSAWQHNPGSVGANDLEAIESMLDDLRTFSTANLLQVSHISVSETVRKIIDGLKAKSVRKGVKISTRAEWGVVPIIGHETLFRLGLTRIVDELMDLCAPGDHLFLSKTNEENGSRFRILSNRTFLRNPELLFAETAPDDMDISVNTLCSLQLGFAMLSVGPSEFKSTTGLRSQEFSFLL